MNTDNPYNLDMESTEPQAMCSERAGEEVLKETFRDYFGGLNYFFAAEQAELFQKALRPVGGDGEPHRGGAVAVAVDAAEPVGPIAAAHQKEPVFTAGMVEIIEAAP